MTGSDAPRRTPPRVRDLPPPRESPSVLGGSFRWVFQWPYRVALYGLYRAGFRPWLLTFLSVATSVAIGVLLLTGRRLVPGALLIPAGLFDVFDGGVARLRGEESRKGALLDSVADRISDGAVFGCLFYAEFVVHGDVRTSALALAAMVASLLVSQFRAEAEAGGVPMSEGSVQRLERYVGLAVGLMVPGALLPVLAMLTVLGLWTAGQRLVGAWNGLGERRR